MAAPRKPASPRATAGPGLRSDPIDELRQPAEQRPPPLYYESDLGVQVCAAKPASGVMIVDDQTLDEAILVLQGKRTGDVPKAFQTFLKKAVYKHALYMPPESCDTSVVLRRTGSASVACEVHLLVVDAERRVDERYRRDAQRRKPPAPRR